MAYPYPLVEVVWDDAATESGWQDPALALQDQHVTTVGFLVKETPKYFLIASTFADAHVNATIQIPVGMIVSRRDVTLKSKPAKRKPDADPSANTR